MAWPYDDWRNAKSSSSEVSFNLIDIINFRFWLKIPKKKFRSTYSAWIKIIQFLQLTNVYGVHSAVYHSSWIYHIPPLTFKKILKGEWIRFLKLFFNNDNHLCCKLYRILVYVFMIYKENVYGFIKTCKQEQSKYTCIWFMYTLLVDRTNYMYFFWSRGSTVYGCVFCRDVNYITANPAGSDKLLIY